MLWRASRFCQPTSQWRGYLYNSAVEGVESSRLVGGRKIFKMGMRVNVKSVVSKPTHGQKGMENMGSYLARLGLVGGFPGDQIVGFHRMLILDL